MVEPKELGIEAGMDISTVCRNLVAAAPASAEFNGVRLTTRAGDTAETLYARWNAQFRAQYEESAREQYRARVARVRQIICSASVDEAARAIVDELHPMDRYGR